MFEKEAEEAGNQKIKENNQFARCARKSYKDGFKDGAEFGYRKANLKALRKYELNVAKLEQRNAELRNIAEFQQSSNMNRYFENKKLKDENTGLKEKLKHNNKSCPNDGSCVHYNKWEDYKNPQLTKAKEIIKDYMIIAKGAHITVCGISEENRTINVLQLNEEAEQFIKDMEI